MFWTVGLGGGDSVLDCWPEVEGIVFWTVGPSA